MQLNFHRNTDSSPTTVTVRQLSSLSPHNPWELCLIFIISAYTFYRVSINVTTSVYATPLSASSR